MLKETRALLGYQGTYYLDDSDRRAKSPESIERQIWISAPIAAGRQTGIAGALMTVEITFDDHCHNGYNIFYITAEVFKRGKDDVEMWGCLHNLIPEVFPGFISLIQWHDWCIDGQNMLNYVGNTLYHTSDKDCWGLSKDQPRIFEDRLLIPGNPDILMSINRELFSFLKAIENDPKSLANLQVVEVIKPDRQKESGSYCKYYSFASMETKHYYNAPFHSLEDAVSMKAILQKTEWSLTKVPTQFSQGKVPDLKAARKCARWPEATDQQLLNPNLKETLLARHPALDEKFKRQMQTLFGDSGFLLERPKKA